MKLNNVDIDKIYNAEKEIYDDLALTQKNTSVEGKWNFNTELSQFTASLKYPKGDTIIKTDNPVFLGGNHSQPEPMQYFLFGIAASYASAFTNRASIKGIELEDLVVKADVKLNYSYFFSISDDPKIEEINILLEVESNSSREELVRVKNEAFECCAALSAIDESVIVNVRLEILNHVDNFNVN